VNKKRMAAISGVFYYLRDEEKRHRAGLHEALVRPWTGYGRKTGARLQGLVQGKVFKKQKPLTLVNEFTYDKYSSLQSAKSFIFTQRRLITRKE